MTCNHPRCKTEIDRNMYACPRHWLLLPLNVRQDLANGFRNMDAGLWLNGHQAASEVFLEDPMEVDSEIERRLG